MQALRLILIERIEALCAYIWRKAMKNNINVSTALSIPSLPSHSSETSAALLWARELLQQHEEPGKILVALVNKVLPFAQGGTGREINNA